MAKKQTRRSVSIKGSTYDTVRAYCEQHGLSMSEFMEERIAGFFSGTTPPRRQAEPRAKPQREHRPRMTAPANLNSRQLHDAARYFTF
jgi:hypothetical protein